MCDYWLHRAQYRLAVEGEPLQLYRFPSGSIALTSPRYLEAPRARSSSTNGWWEAIKRRLVAQRFGMVPIVRVPPGVRLVIRDVPISIQQIFEVSEEEEVTLIQSGSIGGKISEGVRFRNGLEILFEHFPLGQRFDVLRLTTETEELAILQAVERIAQAS